jgi:hypothetical protein
MTNDVQHKATALLKATRKKIELMTASEKATFDQVIQYMTDQKDIRHISLEEARTIFEIAFQQYQAATPSEPN